MTPVYVQIGTGVALFLMVAYDLLTEKYGRLLLSAVSFVSIAGFCLLGSMLGAISWTEALFVGASYAVFFRAIAAVVMLVVWLIARHNGTQVNVPIGRTALIIVGLIVLAPILFFVVVFVYTSLTSPAFWGVVGFVAIPVLIVLAIRGMDNGGGGPDGGGGRRPSGENHPDYQ